jgi:beta-glucosidase
VKELKGFQKVRLDAGESRHVTINLDRRAFAYYNVENRDWTVDAGEFSVSVGSSSEQIELTGKIPR